MLIFYQLVVGFLAHSSSLPEFCERLQRQYLLDSKVAIQVTAHQKLGKFIASKSSITEQAIQVQAFSSKQFIACKMQNLPAPGGIPNPTCGPGTALLSELSGTDWKKAPDNEHLTGFTWARATPLPPQQDRTITAERLLTGNKWYLPRSIRGIIYCKFPKISLTHRDPEKKPQ